MGPDLGICRVIGDGDWFRDPGGSPRKPKVTKQQPLLGEDLVGALALTKKKVRPHKGCRYFGPSVPAMLGSGSCTDDPPELPPAKAIIEELRVIARDAGQKFVDVVRTISVGASAREGPREERAQDSNRGRKTYLVEAGITSPGTTRRTSTP